MHDTPSIAATDPNQVAVQSDRELVERVRADEPKAFEPVMRRYNRRLFRAARSVTGSDADAEDVVQEAYVKAYLHLAEFRGEHLGAWLTRIVLNEALMHRRGATRRASQAGGPIDDENPRHGDAMAHDERVRTETPEEAASQGQLRRLLERAIDRLPESYRLTYVLREMEQLPASEVAASLSISTVTVKTRVFRARRLLRKALSKEFHVANDDAYPFDGARCDRTVDAVFRRLAESTADSNEPLH